MVRYGRATALVRGIVGGCLILATTLPAVAIAPPEQRTNPTQFDNFFSVVDMDKAPTLGNVTGTVGTGTVIGSEIINNIGYFCVLTADHNIPTSTSIGFGDFGVAPNPAGAFTNYPIVNVARGGSTGKEDIALAVIQYGAVDPFFVSVKDIGLWTPPNTNDPTVLANYVSKNVASFTEIGDGISGTRHFNAAGNQDGWTPDGAPFRTAGTQRFQNNVVTGATPNSAHFGYTYTDVHWRGHFPTFANSGEGTSFGGDSGGPYFLEQKVTKTITGLTDIQGNPLPAQNIQLYSDTIFAVHTFGNNNNPQLYTDNVDSGGVVLSQADINWIAARCAAIPEPSGWLLILIGGGSIGLVVRRRRPDARMS